MKQINGNPKKQYLLTVLCGGFSKIYIKIIVDWFCGLKFLNNSNKKPGKAKY